MQVTQALTFAAPLLVLAGLARGQEASTKQEAPPPQAAAFFRVGRVSFWGDLKQSKRDRLEAEAAPVESLWAEPIRLPDGRVSVYVPPAPVLRFVESPSRETGEKYLAWQEERMRRIKAAIEVLRAIQSERQKGVEAPPAAQDVDVLYFKKDGCPWCREEDKVLAALTKEHPGIKVRTATQAEAPELWKEYGVGAVPMLVVRTPSGNATVFRGFTPAPNILEALQEASRDKR